MIISPVKNIDALDRSDPYDVCVIGSGPSGTFAATSLATQGFNTLLIESGANLYQWLFNRKVRDLAAYEFTGDTDYPLKNTKARILGGNSNFWTGRCERFHPSDFDNHPYTPGENPWPITYKDLNSFYIKAENMLRVRGDERSEFAPPRELPLPLPAKPDISYLKRLLSRADVVVDDTPTATPTKTIRFFKVQKEILSDFLGSGHGTLVTGATATRLLPDSKGQIIGVRVQIPDGTSKMAKAKIYIVACGGIETPRLLLLSHSESHPEGIGNSCDMVGRGFNEHPGVNFYAKIPHESGTLVPTNKIARSHQFYGTFREEGLGSIVPVFRQSWILPHHTMPLKLSNIPRQIASAASRIRKATLYAGVNIEQKISMSNCVTLSKTRHDIFGNPIAHLRFNYSEEDLQLLDKGRELTLDIYRKLRATDILESEVTWSRHHQGTCRMGTSEKTSVVDQNLKIHGISNLYICGSEVFVTGGAMQPLLTIAALSLRLSDHLISTNRVA